MSILDPAKWRDDITTHGDQYDKILELINYLNKVLKFFNGTFSETMDADVTSDGATITLSLQKEGTGDLTMNFSDGESILDCTPALTVSLTAGTSAIPVLNYTYILKSAPTIITVSTSGFPSAEHIRIATAWVQTAALVNAGTGLLEFQEHNEHAMDSNNMGHAVHFGNAIRKRSARYDSGIDGDESGKYYKLGVGTTYFRSTAGIVNQLHEQIFAAFDSEAGDHLHIINWLGDAYHTLTNLFDIEDDALGNSIGNNKYFNLVFIGVANKTGTDQAIMVNLPLGFYNTEEGALSDVSKFDVYSLPREISIDSSTGFLIARITFQMGTTWAVDATTGTIDLRGETPSSAGGAVNAAITEFSDTNFEIFNGADPTKMVKFNAGGLSAATERTKTFQDTNGTLAELTDIADYDADLLIGSGNITWVDCVYEDEGSTTRISSMRAEGVNNLGSSPQTLVFNLPKEKNRGGLALFVKDVRVLLFDADGSNKIGTTRIRAMNTSGITTVFTHASDLSTIALHTLSNAAADNVSTYNKVMVYINTTVATAFALEIAAVQVECYYA